MKDDKRKVPPDDYLDDRQDIKEKQLKRGFMKEVEKKWEEKYPPKK